MLICLENGITMYLSFLYWFRLKISFKLRKNHISKPSRYSDLYCIFCTGTPGSNAENGSCIKCTVIGEWDKKGRHMSYPRIHCPPRTDESFRYKIDEDHHKEHTPLTDLPIDMIEDFVVADSLHLFDLGKL